MQRYTAAVSKKHISYRSADLDLHDPERINVADPPMPLESDRR